jgi:hypothetical protein
MSNGKPEKNTKRPPVAGSPRPKLESSSHPDISIGEAPLGRQTLSDVKDDLRRAPGPRAPMMTVSYNDLPLDAKRAAAEPPQLEVQPQTTDSLWKSVDAGPAIELGEGALGRETLAMIEAEDEEADVLPLVTTKASVAPPPAAKAEAPTATLPSFAPPKEKRTGAAAQTAPKARAVQCEALELKSFIVPASALSPKANEDTRRAFVRDRLAEHLPCDIERVKRVDARLFEPGAVLVRVFCPID